MKNGIGSKVCKFEMRGTVLVPRKIMIALKGREVCLVKNYSGSNYNHKTKESQRDSSGMDIPDYAFERMAKCLLPLMRTYFESSEGQEEISAIEEESRPRWAA